MRRGLHRVDWAHRHWLERRGESRRPTKMHSRFDLAGAVFQSPYLEARFSEDRV